MRSRVAARGAPGDKGTRVNGESSRGNIACRLLYEHGYLLELVHNGSTERGRRAGPDERERRAFRLPSAARIPLRARGDKEAKGLSEQTRSCSTPNTICSLRVCGLANVKLIVPARDRPRGPGSTYAYDLRDASSSPYHILPARHSRISTTTSGFPSALTFATETPSLSPLPAILPRTR